MMYDWILQAGFSPIVIATKADKIKRSQLAKHKKMIKESIAERSRVSGEVSLKIIPWSGLSKAGREEIYQILDREVLGIEEEADPGVQ
jgi:GTP-binding protein